MIRYIVIRTQFEALHKWPDSPEDLYIAFLRYPHRHIFHVTMKWKVGGDNREIEFITMKNKVEVYIQAKWHTKDLGSMSCEQIAGVLAREFDSVFVSVFEDNENGAEVYND